MPKNAWLRTCCIGVDLGTIRFYNRVSISAGISVGISKSIISVRIGSLRIGAGKTRLTSATATTTAAVAVHIDRNSMALRLDAAVNILLYMASKE